MTDIHWDAIALLDGGWKPEDRDEIKAEFELDDDEADDLCAEMENILNGRNSRYDWAEDDEADLKYHEARDAGELNWK